MEEIQKSKILSIRLLAFKRKINKLLQKRLPRNLGQIRGSTNLGRIHALKIRRSIHHCGILAKQTNPRDPNFNVLINPWVYTRGQIFIQRIRKDENKQKIQELPTHYIVPINSHPQSTYLNLTKSRVRNNWKSKAKDLSDHNQNLEHASEFYIIFIF